MKQPIPASWTRSISPRCLTGLALCWIGWTAHAFFAAFDQGHAVQYFYEPSLKRSIQTFARSSASGTPRRRSWEYLVDRVDAVLRDGAGDRRRPRRSARACPRSLFRHWSLPGGGTPAHRRTLREKGGRRPCRARPQAVRRSAGLWI